MTYKSGDIRADGYIFSQYSKAKNGIFYELWLSPDARKRDLERRRARIAAKRADLTFLAAEREAKNAVRRARYKADAEYKAKAIRAAVSQESKASKRPEWRAKRNAQKSRRSRERYKADADYRAVVCEKRASRRCIVRSGRKERATIRQFYLMRDRVTKCVGVQFHVDHIRAISRGGLHTASNLQILPARINQRKHAR